MSEFRGLITFFRWILAFFRTYKTAIPKGFSAIFILFNLITDVINEPSQALPNLAKTLFAAEKVIHDNVQLAINNDPTYTFLSFLAILNAVLVLYFLIKGFMFLNRWSQGANPSIGAWGFAIIFLAILELSVVRIVDGVAFIPIYDGLFFLMINIGPVISNINWFGLSSPQRVSDVVEGLNSTDTTMGGIGNQTI